MQRSDANKQNLRHKHDETDTAAFQRKVTDPAAKLQKKVDQFH
jgi:hypothetical protein